MDDTKRGKNNQSHNIKLENRVHYAYLTGLGELVYLWKIKH